MGDLTPSRAAEIQAFREAYAALNRNDVAAMVGAFDPQIEWVEPAESPGAGMYRGRAAVEEFVSRMRGTWTEGGCEPQQFLAAGDKIVVLAHVRARMNSGEWVEGDVADVYTFRNGKVVQRRGFFDIGKALA